MTLEELLNKLIKRGWKPFGRETKHELSSGVVYDTIDFKGKGDIRVIDRRHHHIRELVSKESGLWQFVCENGMVDDGVEYKGYALVDVDGGAISKYETGCRYLYSNIEPEFYIMESALIDELLLDDFLLENIKL